MSKYARTLTATYRITTPMFLSGADQSKAELRLASLKGALRFWWRSLMWGKVQDVGELREREGKLFGSSRHGQSLVRMRLLNLDMKRQDNKGQVFERGRLNGVQYLGYGVISAGKPARPMILGGSFTIEISFHPSTDETSIENVCRALILLGTVGGLGSKSRKGFGSLSLTNLNNDGEEKILADDPAQRLKQVLGTLHNQLPEWTAWCQISRIVKVKSVKNSAIELLDSLGREQVHYRSWGKNGKVLDKDREPNFKEDHDLFKRQNKSIKYPRRVAFGLPHNYGNGEANEVKPVSHERRASPLFLHIHELNDDTDPVGMVVYLPARFLPENEKLKVFGNDVDIQVDEGFWNPICGYLDRLKGAEDATKKQTDLQGEEVELV